MDEAAGAMALAPCDSDKTTALLLWALVQSGCAMRPIRLALFPTTREADFV